MTICNLDYLHKVSYGDTTFIAETVQAFLQHTPTELKKLHDALSQEQIESVAYTAHALKSSLKMLGMTSTHKACLALEQEAKVDGDIKKMQQYIATIEQDCTQAYQELAHALKKL